MRTGACRLAQKGHTGLCTFLLLFACTLPRTIMPAPVSSTGPVNVTSGAGFVQVSKAYHIDGVRRRGTPSPAVLTQTLGSC